jgi:hypothetical protein
MYLTLFFKKEECIMIFNLVSCITDFFSTHVILGNFVHFAGGFGVALILQHYLKGRAFLPVAVGWILITISATVHIMGLMSC